MYTDRIDLTLPEDHLASILSFLLSSEELLAPLQSVSPSDRKHLAKLGLKNEGLARQIIEVGRANPGLIPRDIDFEPIDRDLLARDLLRSLKIVLERLLGRINDSLLLTGVDIYAAALSIYHCLKRNGQTASLRAVVEELKQGFARPSRKKRGDEQTETSVSRLAAADVPEKAAQEARVEVNPNAPEMQPPTVSAAASPVEVPSPSTCSYPPHHSFTPAVLFTFSMPAPSSPRDTAVRDQTNSQPQTAAKLQGSPGLHPMKFSGGSCPV